MDTKINKSRSVNLLSVLLLLSGCFMGGMLISKSSQTAIAGTSQSSGGKYILNVANVSKSEDVLYVTNTSTRQMNLYTIKRRSNNYYFEFRDRLNLANLSRNAAERLGGDEDKDKDKDKK